MNECNSEHWDLFSLPLIDGILLNIELYSCNAFLSINSTLNVGLSIWWIAKAHNKVHFIMYMWQPPLLLKYLPNTIMLLKSSKINIKSQPQVRISFLPNHQALPQCYPYLKAHVFRSSPEFAGNDLINCQCHVHLLSTSEEKLVISFFHSLDKTVSMPSIHKADSIMKRNLTPQPTCNRFRLPH